MADEILRVDKAQETSRTGTALWVQKGGAATPSTYEDFYILPDDFLSPEQTRLTTNESNIASNTARIVVLEGILTKRLDTGENSAYTFTQTADSEIEKIYINLDGGTPTVRIGTTLNGEELVSDEIITAQYKKDINFSKGFTAASRTIYVTITGGSVDIAFYSVESIFN